MQKTEHTVRNISRRRMTLIFLFSFLLIVLVCGFIYAAMKKNEADALTGFLQAQDAVARSQASELSRMQRDGVDTDTQEKWLQEQSIGGFDTTFSMNAMDAEDTEKQEWQDPGITVTSRINPAGDGYAQSTAAWTDQSGWSHTLTLSTSRDSVLSASGAEEHTYYVVLASLLMGLVLFGVLITNVGHLNQTEKELSGTRDRLQIRDAQMGNPDILAETAALRQRRDRSVTEIAGRGGSESEYRFKFYLNARHAIYTNGVAGEVHPHTWEIGIRVRKVRDAFIPFDRLEKKTNAFLDKYQNQVLNEIPPFDTLNPTAENLAAYFAAEITPRLEEDGWELLELEISESPSRIYVLEME